MAKSFLRWVGGKSLLAKRIIQMMPDHECYVEPFCGAAHVFFRKPPSPVEVINDINGELINLYRCVREHMPEMLRLLQYMPISRVEFERLRDCNPENLTDVQRAVRFFYLQRLCFGGKVDKKKSYGYTKRESQKAKRINFPEYIDVANKRLIDVNIECKPYDDILVRYDTPETLFYCDPPYLGTQDFYGKGCFEIEDYCKLADVLKNIKGKFILSINDTPETRAIFNSFTQHEAKTTYSVKNGATRKAGESVRKELIYTNF